MTRTVALVLSLTLTAKTAMWASPYFDFASGARGPQALRVKILDEPRPRSRNRQTKHKYTPEELGSLIADMVTTLEERVQPPLTAGRYPDRKEGKQIAEALRIIAKELDG